MEANEQTFHHSFSKLALIFLGLVLFGFLVYAGVRNYFLFTVISIGIIAIGFYSTSSVKVSDQEITTKKILKSKSLRWSEIARVSIRGQTLRLHNRDEDIVLLIDPQLEGYSAILDLLFKKRPDLLNLGENNVMARSLLNHTLIIGYGLLIMMISIPLFISREHQFDWFFGLVFIGIGIYVIISWFLSAQSMVLENKDLLLISFFKEIHYSANDINSISLEKTRTKNGYVYFAQINLKSGKKIKLPGFKQGSVITYQMLKRWHEKATSGLATYFV